MRVVNTVNVVDDEELKRVGRELFKEDNEKIDSDIDTIKQWLASAPHMQNTCHDDEFLRMFLREAFKTKNQKQFGLLPNYFHFSGYYLYSLKTIYML